MASSAVFDLTGDVTLTQFDFEEPRAMRVVVSQDRIVFATGELKQAVSLADVFDITRDVSQMAVPDASETVSIAYEVGGTTEIASIRARADALVRFQGALYGELLGDTQCAVSHERSGDTTEQLEGRFRVQVTASRIQFEPQESAEMKITVRREEIVEFRALEGALNDEQHHSEVLLVTSDGSEMAKTIVGFPSDRYRNLFGRYLKSELQLGDRSEPDETTRSGSIELLLVDDDPQDLHAAEMFLEQRPEPFSIEMAAGADSGLEVLETRNIDCIVSDFRMPGMDGIEFLQTVRGRWSDMPFILYTGKGNERVAKRAILDDVTDYVEKGVGTEQYDILAERINRAIQQPARRRGR
jgi:CheY-like chemotaxis protein